MKVVLFCGGLGMRMREFSETIPKPLVPLGRRPILWHLMRYYAHFGHTEFILCLGHKADLVRRYFLNGDEWLANEPVFSSDGEQIERFRPNSEDWTITFVDTGLHANIGQRLKAVQPCLEDDDAFMANYADGLSNLPLDAMLADFHRHGKVAGFMIHQPTQSFHVVALNHAGAVKSIGPLATCGVYINAGFFVFNRRIFDYLGPGEELVEEPFQRLLRERQLHAYRHSGFWAAMDTFKDKQLLDELSARGDAPWEVWRTNVLRQEWPLPLGKC